MGSVKDLILDDSAAGRLYVPPSATEFGRGAWQVKGTFSVADLKDFIPQTEIKDKGAALAMMSGAFFEYLDKVNSEIPVCYLGLLDARGEIVDTTTLLDRGETSDIIVMQLAHTPDTWCRSNLTKYRKALASGALQCGVSDVESIFRQGFPLGSSTFKRIFKAVGRGKEYEQLATYDETVVALDKIRNLVTEKGLESFPNLAQVLEVSGLQSVPNPGTVLDRFVYDSTTKFEAAGDREIAAKTAAKLSGLSNEGYDLWTKEMFPAIAEAQIEFANERKLLNIDGKAECVAFRRQPVVADLLCTTDENRLMIITKVNGEEWAIPSNKEIQRAIFRSAGVYAAIAAARVWSTNAYGDESNWRAYLPNTLKMKEINLQEVAEHSCNLMGNAIGEVANRILGREVFETNPLETWVEEFMPYASKIERI